MIFYDWNTATASDPPPIIACEDSIQGIISVMEDETTPSFSDIERWLGMQSLFDDFYRVDEGKMKSVSDYFDGTEGGTTPSSIDIERLLRDFSIEEMEQTTRECLDTSTDIEKISVEPMEGSIEITADGGLESEREIPKAFGGGVQNRVKDLRSLFDCLAGFITNTILDLMIDPGTKAYAFLKSLPRFLVVMFDMARTNFLTRHRRVLINALLTGVIQSSLEPRTANESLAQSMDPEVVLNLLRDSQRPAMLATAAYGINEISAVRRVQPAMAAGPFDFITEPFMQITKMRIAKYLNISEEDILHMSEPGDTGGIIPHFVAVDHKSSSVVLAIRGTNSLTNLLIDGQTKQGKCRHGNSMGSLLEPYPLVS